MEARPKASTAESNPFSSSVGEPSSKGARVLAQEHGTDARSLSDRLNLEEGRHRTGLVNPTLAQEELIHESNDGSQRLYPDAADAASALAPTTA